MPNSISSKNIERAIVKGAKKIIAESGLNPSTRSGNKELSHWITNLSNQSFPSLQSAIAYGESLGHKIVERSQATNKAHLDQGVIRHLRLQGDLPTIADSAASVSPAKAAETAVQGVVSQTARPTAAKNNSVEPVAEIAKSLVETPSIEESMSKSESEAESIVSVPVDPKAATAETATVSDIEDSEPIPADTETAKVEINPTPHIESAPEEPTSVAETVVAEEIMATEDNESAEVEDEEGDDEN